MDSSCLIKKPCQTHRVKQSRPTKDESKQRSRTQDGTTKPYGRKIGYVRVSDADQSEALQIDALKAAGCAKLYTDHGVSFADEINRDFNLNDGFGCDAVKINMLRRVFHGVKLHIFGDDFLCFTING